MRTAVAQYVEGIHRAYVNQAGTYPPAVRGGMPLINSGTVHVAAAATKNLHLLATTEPFGPLSGQEVELTGECGGLAWTLRFFDPVVLPALGLIDESGGPAQAEVRRELGVTTVLYHVLAQPGSGLSSHHAAHVGTSLAGSDSATARDFETIRHRCRGAEDLVDELIGAAAAGLPRAQALLAAAVRPYDATLAELSRAPQPDPLAVRRALLASVGASGTEEHGSTPGPAQ